jgi:uncharacterized protein YbjT (DUF2867 family)
MVAGRPNLLPGTAYRHCFDTPISLLEFHRMPTASPTGRSVLVVGATGLVGSEVVEQLAADPAVDRIVILARRQPATLPPRAELHLVDFDRLGEYENLFTVDQIICALGTTIRQAGSRAAFRQVDLEYPLAVARIGLKRGAHHFLLVSALGANAASAIFYNRVKGELEDQLRTLGYRSVTIARPSLLLGNRGEFRLIERIGMVVGELIPGRYRPVQASAVARTLVRAARQDAPGLHIIESEEIRAGIDPSRAGEWPE